MGANELVACNGGVLRTVEAGDWERFGDPLPKHSALSGVLAFALRRFGIGLLSG